MVSSACGANVIILMDSSQPNILLFQFQSFMVQYMVQYMELKKKLHALAPQLFCMLDHLVLNKYSTMINCAKMP